MYLVGVIPGPSKPSTVEINHFLAVLVDELLLFWTPGVRYTRTALHALGRMVRLAVIPLVCDLVGARQVAGVGPHGHNHMLCTCCTLSQDDVEDTRPGKPRSLEAHLADAKAWRDAKSTYEREKLFKSNGIRWTELLRLGYWNPILYVVIDSMHDIYLGLLQRHIRDFWGIHTKLDDGDASGRDSVKAPPRPSRSVMDTGLDCLLHGSDVDLEACGRPVLYYLCMERNLRHAGTTRMLTRNLVIWVPIQRATVPAKLVGSGALMLERARTSTGLAQRGLAVLRTMCKLRQLSADGTRAILAYRLWAWFQREDRISKGLSLEPDAQFPSPTQPGSPESPRSSTVDDPVLPRLFTFIRPATAALGRQTLAEYVRDRSHLQVPSWVNPPPLAFGTTEHGKLSADQWRTVALISLPVTLIRTWGLEAGRRFDMLVNFLHLVEAVATLDHFEADHRTMARADKLLQQYLDGVKELYKGSKIQPNHHASLHLTMFIALFGPVHSWRAFAFERLNYMMQSLNINGNFGELEMTFMMQISRMANLRPLLRTEPVRTAMPFFTAAYDRIAEEDRRGIRLDETLRSSDGDAVHVVASAGRKTCRNAILEDAIYNALRDRLRLEGIQSKGDGSGRNILEADSKVLSRSVVAHTTLSIRGVLYKCERTSCKDSNIVFRHPAFNEERPGRISHIFSHRRTSVSGYVEEMFIAVRAHENLNAEDRSQDPYRRFPVGGNLYYDVFDRSAFIVRPADILCHFARTSMKGAEFKRTVRGSDRNTTTQTLHFAKPCVHVLKLDRVGVRWHACSTHTDGIW
ncbi:hypothetical protein C8Q76DRAFT_630733 [Earliella scabrosa]|nr:hypothetical protein C8Q76DRAFT_630733 [Earliella scabrosa]